MSGALFETPAGPVTPAGPAGRPVLIVRVYGTPGPQGSKHARPIYKGTGKDKVFTGKVAQVESSAKVKPWREAVKHAALERMGRAPLRLDGPLAVEFVFTLARPKSAPRSRIYPDRMPDLSKLIRATEDALTDAGVWTDDARVVRYVDPRKVYTGARDLGALEIPGALIKIWELK